MQAPLTHTLPGEHALPQAPQWFALVRVSTHDAPHKARPSVQLPTSMRASMPPASLGGSDDASAVAGPEQDGAERGEECPRSP